MQALAGVSLDLCEGGSVGLVGESGSGKTVFAETVLQVLPSNARVSGSIRWHGNDLITMSESDVNGLRGREIALVMQDSTGALNPALRIREQLKVILHAHNSRRIDVVRVGCDLLQKVGVPNPLRVLNAYPRELSGGMAQRVAIAMAISCSPKLLIADEPTSALDATVAFQVVELLKELRQTLGLSLLVISHDIGVVSHCTEFVAVMHQGKIVEFGPTPEVLACPSHGYTRSLLESNMAFRKYPILESTRIKIRPESANSDTRD